MGLLRVLSRIRGGRVRGPVQRVRLLHPGELPRDPARGGSGDELLRHDPGGGAAIHAREHARILATRIATESLRYSTDLPGQALAYQMGKRKLLELRARAEDALGDGFDIRGFHDAVLRNGSVPMVVLEGQVDAWIDAWIDAEGGGR
ncbi:DUF885 family protein [Candidatus Palauibacter sp.]|uniref:DUF885 family protein n=1 Tax=Candidatus Palauibacter sp. TaxID=3101350 RepID=UPI003B025DF2